MVTSIEIPSSYTTQWSTGTRQPPTQASTAQSLARPVYNSSCNNCRASRVKCSGGHPCKRCANLLDAPLCVYRISQRHGKRKGSNTRAASDGRRNSNQQSTRTTSPPSLQNSPSSVSFNFNSLFETQLSSSDLLQFSPTQLVSGSSPDTTYRNHDDGTIGTTADGYVWQISPDNFMLDESLSSTEEARRSSEISGGTVPSTSSANQGFSGIDGNSTLGIQVANFSNSCDCYLSNQTLLGRINLAVTEGGKSSLDKVLSLLQEVAEHITSYQICPHCTNGHPRLVNLAMLHQSQVTLLHNIRQNPTAYFGLHNGIETTRFTLGVYRPSEEEDMHHKRLAILTAARRLELSVDGFDDLIRSHHDIGIDSDLDMSDSVRINLKWLLDVTRNLKSRLKSIIPVLEKIDSTSVAK